MSFKYNSAVYNNIKLVLPNTNEKSWLCCFKPDGNAILNKKEFEELWNEHPVEYNEVMMYGKTVKTPRWQQSYEHEYYYTGMTHGILTTPPILSNLLEWANDFIEKNNIILDDHKFNGILVNWYADGSHYIGYHADNESDLVTGSPILSLTYTDAIEPKEWRRFLLKHNTTDDVIEIPLPNNTGLVMGGNLQKTHKHSVPKTTKKMARRINVTFRCFKN